VLRFVIIRLLLAVLAVSAAILVGLASGPGRARLPALEPGVAVIVSAVGGCAAVLAVFAVVAMASSPWRSRRRRVPLVRLQTWVSAAACFCIGAGIAKAASGPPFAVGFLVAGMAASTLAGCWIGAAAIRVTVRRDSSAQPTTVSSRGVGLGLLAVVLALGVWFLLAPSPPGGTDLAEPPSYRARVDGPVAKFLCVFVDGVDRAGLETLAAPFGPGTTIRLESNEALPPTFWQTVATGCVPQQHGLTGSASRCVLLRRSGRYRSSVRRPWADAFEALVDLAPVPRPGRPDPRSDGPKPIWVIASEAGRTVGVVGAWNSWPAPRVRRFSVADVAPVVYFEAAAAVHGVDASSPSGLVWPETKPRWHGRLRDLSRTILEARSGVDSTDPRRADAFVLGALECGVLEFPPAPDLLVVHLIGPDLAGLGTGPARSSDSHLNWLANRLADLGPSLRGKDRTVVFVGHPGVRRAGDAPYLWVSGSGTSGRPPRPATGLSFAPTVLHGLGIPLSRELSGTWLEDLLPPAVRAAPVTWVDTYGRYRPAWPAREGQPNSNLPPGLPYLSR